MNLDRNILIFDFETTCDDKEEAWICQYSWQLREGRTGSLVRRDTNYVNPQAPIEPDATEVHGITNEQVADEPTFEEFAPDLEELLMQDIIISGYNNRQFDDIVLEREFARAGHSISLAEKPNLDAFAFFKRFYPMSLEGVVKILLDEDMTDAHDAEADVYWTWQVIRELLDRHGDEFPSRAFEINDFLYPGHVDREGKLRFNEDGEACFTFGKLEGMTLREAVRYEQGYLEWMMGKDFPADLIQIIRDALGGEFPVAPTGQEAV